MSAAINGLQMNPLSLDPAKFTVVENSKDGVVAFAQLEQQQATAGKPVYEFRSLVVAPQHRWEKTIKHSTLPSSAHLCCFGRTMI
jgi:N-acetylglutamate synthase-like GNAT family acetyltransferase